MAKFKGHLHKFSPTAKETAAVLRFTVVPHGRALFFSMVVWYGITYHIIPYRWPKRMYGRYGQKREFMTKTSFREC